MNGAAGAGTAGTGTAETGPVAAAGPWQEALGWRRTLQLALAALWLLDAVLQYQSFMFSQGFPRMLAATAAGNPRIMMGVAMAYMLVLML